MHLEQVSDLLQDGMDAARRDILSRPLRVPSEGGEAADGGDVGEGEVGQVEVDLP